MSIAAIVDRHLLEMQKPFIEERRIMNALAIIVAAVATFLASAAWYAGFDRIRRRITTAPLPERPAWLTPVAELLRNALLGTVVAALAGALQPSAGEAILLAVGLFVFPLVLLSGSVIHESTPIRVALVHLGDWAIKIAVLTAVISLWR